ncbi:hypothetical protein RQP46_003949 [Phenoliferia psychrophenolica]
MPAPPVRPFSDSPYSPTRPSSATYQDKDADPSSPTRPADRLLSDRVPYPTGRKSSPTRPAVPLFALYRRRWDNLKVFGVVFLFACGALLTTRHRRAGALDAGAGQEWNQVDQASLPLSKAQLQDLVGPNPRFLVKDNGWSFGYNNVRYMAESTLAFGKVMNRVPIIAEYIWARECGVASEICAKYALKHIKDRNHDPDVGENGWVEDGEAFKLPISEFIDMPHFRRTFGPVLTFTEYLTLHDMSPSLSGPRGFAGWYDVDFLPPTLTSSHIDAEYTNQSYHKNAAVYEDQEVYIRVDQVEPAPRVGVPVKGLTKELIASERGVRMYWSMEKAKVALERHGLRLPQDDQGFIRAMEGAGQTVVYTFSDKSIMNHALAFPSCDFVPTGHTRSLASMDNNASIFIFHGGYHDRRRPGAVRFTTAAARDDFANVVMRAIRPPERYRVVAERVAKRMTERAGGRKWMAAHLRRGDFIVVGWAAETSYEADMAHITNAFKEGVEKLRDHSSFGFRRLPRPKDPFFLATDDVSPIPLDYYRSQGAVLLADLLTPSDLAILGWQASFLALQALVEQEVLSHSDFFVGSFMSSTTGGALNMRAVKGKPAWSSVMSHTPEWINNYY